MRSFSLRTPSPAMAVAMAALFVSLGGTGYAASQLDHAPSAVVAKKKKKKTPPAHPDSAADKKLFSSLIPSARVAFATSAGSASTAITATTATSANHASTADSATNASHASSADTATTANSLPALTWHDLTLENGWLPYPGPYASTPRYTKDLSGFVHLSGTLEGPGTANTFAVLPEGFRPTTLHAWITVASTNGGFDPHLVNLDIESNGKIFVYNGSEAHDSFVSLEGATFYAG